MLLRGEFDVSWAGASHRIGPRADVFSGYPHAVYLPARTPFRVVARDGLRDCRRARGVEEGARAAGDPAGGLRLRDSRRRQRDPADRRHRAAGVSGGSAADLRGVHARRQLVVVSAAQARHRRPAARSRSRGDLLFPLSGSERIRLPARLYQAARRHACASPTATSSRSATAFTRLLQPMATMPTT